MSHASARDRPSPEELRQIYLFEQFDEGDLAHLANHVRILKLARWQMLFSIGEPVAHFYYVVSGQVKLFRTSKAGAEKVIAVQSAGRTFAEAAMFMGSDGYPVNAQAVARSELLAVEAAAVRELLGGSVDMCFDLLGQLSQRLQGLVSEVERISLQSATCRLVAFLLERAYEDEVERREVELNTPKLVLASRLSLQPETMSRILHNLTDKGLIEVSGPRISLRNIDGLRRMLDS